MEATLSVKVLEYIGLNGLALKMDRAGQRQWLFCSGNDGLSSDIFL